MSSSTSARSAPLLAALLVLAAGCSEDVVVQSAQLNSSGEALTIQVGAAELLPEETIDLSSTTGSVVVGSATIDPSGGPVGTEHQLTVIISDDYEDEVVRVTVLTDSGDRGEDEYVLDGDSADEGYWKISLVSAGEPDEVREDTFTVRLWEEDGTVVASEDTGQ
jgi:hypothetical protein